MVALSGVTFSSGHILIVSAFGTAIAIVQGNREAIAVDSRDGVRWCTSKRLVRRLLHLKLCLTIVPITRRLSRDPLS